MDNLSTEKSAKIDTEKVIDLAFRWHYESPFNCYINIYLTIYLNSDFNYKKKEIIINYLVELSYRLVLLFPL